MKKYEKSDENKRFRRQEQGKLERKRQNINGVRYGDHRPQVNRNSLTIIDSAERVVTIKEPVQSIVVLNSDAASAAKSLGVTDKVVGVTSVVLGKQYYFPELSDRTNVGYPEFNYETILSLKPDLVINYGSGSSYQPKLLEMAEKLPSLL